MTIKIIADSSCDLNNEIKEKYPVALIPFKLYLDAQEFIDDAALDVNDFIGKMKRFSGVPRTACPSPNDFQEAYDPNQDCYAVTISSKLSGTHNSAALAKAMFQEEYPDSMVHVFDSKSASIGETLIVMKIHELAAKSIEKLELIESVDRYISEMRTFFIAESLDNLIKNGRISKFKGAIATALNIKPIMGSDDEGNIQLIEKTRGSAKAFQKLADLIVESAKNVEDKVLAISHADNLEKANWLKEEISKRCQFKDIVIVKTAGLSSLYVDQHGIIVAF